MLLAFHCWNWQQGFPLSIQHSIKWYLFCCFVELFLFSRRIYKCPFILSSTFGPSAFLLILITFITYFKSVVVCSHARMHTNFIADIHMTNAFYFIKTSNSTLMYTLALHIVHNSIIFLQCKVGRLNFHCSFYEQILHIACWHHGELLNLMSDQCAFAIDWIFSSICFVFHKFHFYAPFNFTEQIYFILWKKNKTLKDRKFKTLCSLGRKRHIAQNQEI